MRKIGLEYKRSKFDREAEDYECPNSWSATAIFFIPQLDMDKDISVAYHHI